MSIPEIVTFASVLGSRNHPRNSSNNHANLSENAFLLSDALFIRNFRLNKELVRYILQILTPYRYYLYYRKFNVTIYKREEFTMRKNEYGCIA
jgi:hypothetical protein